MKDRFLFLSTPGLGRSTFVDLLREWNLIVAEGFCVNLKLSLNNNNIKLRKKITKMAYDTL